MLDDVNDLRGRLEVAHILIAQQIAAIAELAAQNANLLHQLMQEATRNGCRFCGTLGEKDSHD